MSEPEKTDVLLVGAGIMSATLSTLLRLVEPDWSMTLVERLDGAAAESSDAWNNAGTGHSALCELNYTPSRPDGTIDISKAVNVNEQFQVSRQFWAYAVENGVLPDVRSFLNPIPHVSFVQGADNVDYLRRRYEALVSNPLFASMEFIDDRDEFTRRLPLMAAGRDFSEPVGLNWTQDGTDVDFGALSRQLIGFGAKQGMSTLFGHEVSDLKQNSDGTWRVQVVNRRTDRKRTFHAKFVFVGAGGGALPLLQKAGIKEAKGFGGFPVGGQWLRSGNSALTAGHQAKVYGLPPLPVHRLRRGSVAPPASGELRAKLGAGRPTAEPGRDADRPYETGLPAASTMVKSDMDFFCVEPVSDESQKQGQNALTPSHRARRAFIHT